MTKRNTITIESKSEGLRPRFYLVVLYDGEKTNKQPEEEDDSGIKPILTKRRHPHHINLLPGESVLLGRHTLAEIGQNVSSQDRSCSRRQAVIDVASYRADTANIKCLGFNPLLIVHKNGPLMELRQGEASILHSGDQFYLYPSNGKGQCLMRFVIESDDVVADVHTAGEDKKSQLISTIDYATKAPGKSVVRDSRPKTTPERPEDKASRSIFKGLKIMLDKSNISPKQLEILLKRLNQEGATIIELEHDESIDATHVVESGTTHIITSRQPHLPGVEDVWILPLGWVQNSLKERTRLDETSFLEIKNSAIELSSTDNSAGNSFVLGHSDSHNVGLDLSHKRQKLDTGHEYVFAIAGFLLDIQNFPVYACQRPTLMDHPNRQITETLDTIISIYSAIGDGTRELSFSRGCAVVRAWPKKVQTRNDLMELKRAPAIGRSILVCINQVVLHGRCERLEQLQTKENMVLVELCKIHGVGPAKARQLYAEGISSVEELHKYIASDSNMFSLEGQTSPLQSAGTIVPTIASTLSTEQKLAVYYFNDLQDPIIRSEAEDIISFVSGELKKCVEASISTPINLEVCGGYRRGKLKSHDLDFLISHPNFDVETLTERAERRLKDVGLLIHSLRNTAGQFPSKDNRSNNFEPAITLLGIALWRKKYRRIDIVTVPHSQWAFQVLGWSGTKQFERDLRRYAHDQKGFSLSQQGLIDLKTAQKVEGVFETEEKIFEVLGLKYLPPHLRCC